MNIVKQKRLLLEKTQQQMGELLGISKQAYHNKENGRTAFSKKEMMQIKNMVKTIEPDVTIDKIFFGN